MKTFSIIFVFGYFLSVFCVQNQNGNVKVETSFFTTKLDHFRPQNSRDVNFTYYENFNYHQDGGPLYLYIKDLRDYSTKYIEYGLMYDAAQLTHGALFTFDLRYFGENIPVDELTWENLEYLSVEQILEDIGTFCGYAKQKYGTSSTKIIIWGTGFGGTLAAWAKLKFPHLIQGAWSSSGLFDLDFTTLNFYSLLEYTLISISTECRSTVQHALERIVEMARNGEGEQLKDILNLCEPVDIGYDVSNLLQLWIDVISDYIDKYQYVGVTHFCDDMELVGDDEPIELLSRWVNFVSKTERTCYDHSYRNMIDRISSTTVVNSEDRVAFYLQCTQFGFLRITDSNTWFPSVIETDYHLTTCQNVLGASYNHTNAILNVKLLKLHFGGYSDQLIDNIVYTNGFIDPWFFDGMTSARGQNATVINIDYHSKSSDLGSMRGFNPQEMIRAKEQIKEKILNWSK